MIPFQRYFLILIAVPVLVGLVSLVTISVIVSSSDEHIYKTVTEAPPAEAAVILGAGILRNGDLSPVLKDRADQAIELYRAGKVEKIIASGNNESKDYDEVQPIRTYLIKNEIPAKAIFMDSAGLDTYSSIYRARDVFKVKSLAIVSQSFHLPRAVFIARKLGIDAFGVSADRGHYKLTNYFREMGADIKAASNLIFNRKPKYLDEHINTEDNYYKDLSAPFTIPIW